MKYWILLAVCFAAGCEERAEPQRPLSEQECTAAEKLLYAAPGCGAEVMPRCLGAAGACGGGTACGCDGSVVATRCDGAAAHKFQFRFTEPSPDPAKCTKVTN